MPCFFLSACETLSNNTVLWCSNRGHMKNEAGGRIKMREKQQRNERVEGTEQCWNRMTGGMKMDGEEKCS